MSSYYELLGIVPGASVTEVEDAYQARYDYWRRLVTSHDRGRANEANVMLQQLETARTVLLDLQKRAAYDLSLIPADSVGGLADPAASAAAKPQAFSSRPAFGIAGHVSDTGACPRCGKQAEFPLSPEMLATKEPLPALSVLKARLLELAGNPGDPLRGLMAEVIAFYPHRSLASLQAMLSRVENPALSPRQRQLLRALILSTADRVNQLWTHPGGRSRPRQLLRPPIFQELNPWQALLAAQKAWSKAEQPVPLRAWPLQPPQLGGITLFRGRLRELIADAWSRLA